MTKIVFGWLMMTIMMVMTNLSLVGSTVEKLPFGSNPTTPLTTDDDDDDVNHHYCQTQHEDHDGDDNRHHDMVDNGDYEGSTMTLL